MKHGIPATILWLCVAATWSLGADTLYVAPGGNHVPPFATPANAATTIQAAVDAADAGDTVSVAPGTYRASGAAAYGANVVAVDKRIAVLASGAHSATIIDGQGVRRCVYVGCQGILSGFTLQNGYASGGGFWMEGAGGGGLSMDGGVISNCLATRCDAGWGAGLAAACGGTVDACRATGNTCEWSGAGLAALEEGAVIACLARDNSGLRAAGLDVQRGFSDRCIVVSNAAGADGGGVLVSFSGVLRNALVTRNTAAGNGAGIQTETPGASVHNCTVANNSAVKHGGGVCDLAGAEIVNTIVYDNVGKTGDSNLYTRGAAPTIVHSCLVPFQSGSGNIPDPPQFRDAGAGDYRLEYLSLCVNGGTNLPWTAGAADLSGNARLVGSTVDMGAYETERIPVPEEPKDVNASAGIYTDKIRLSWQTSEFAEAYVVYRNEVDDMGNAVAISGEITPTSFDDSTAEAGKIYYYWVRALNSSGWSTFSAPVRGYVLPTYDGGNLPDWKLKSKPDKAKGAIKAKGAFEIGTHLADGWSIGLADNTGTNILDGPRLPAVKMKKGQAKLYYVKRPKDVKIKFKPKNGKFKYKLWNTVVPDDAVVFLQAPAAQAVVRAEQGELLIPRCEVHLRPTGMHASHGWRWLDHEVVETNVVRALKP